MAGLFIGMTAVYIIVQGANEALEWYQRDSGGEVHEDDEPLPRYEDAMDEKPPSYRDAVVQDVPAACPQMMYCLQSSEA